MIWAPRAHRKATFEAFKASIVNANFVVEVVLELKDDVVCNRDVGPTRRGAVSSEHC